MSASFFVLGWVLHACLVRSGEISGVICTRGCTNGSPCFDFDPDTDTGPAGKIVGCYGGFTGGAGLPALCGAGYTTVSVAEAETFGMTAEMCVSPGSDQIFFFDEAAPDVSADPVECVSDAGGDKVAGLYGCTNGTVGACEPQPCGSIVEFGCFASDGTIFTGVSGINQILNSYTYLTLADANYGGAICVREPTFAPSEVPSKVPTSYPSEIPTTEPSEFPSSVPTTEPSEIPTSEPSEFPSKYPTFMPSDPTFGPSFVPTSEPTLMPSVPTIVPSKQPSDMPTDTLPPTKIPSSQPSDLPSVSPSDVPTTQPSDEPTTYPSLGPTNQPTDEPTKTPTEPPIEVVGGTGTKEDSGLIGSLSDELSYLIIAGGACLLCILIAVIVVCMKKKQNEKATQGGNSTEMAGMTAFKVHSDGATPNNSHYQEDRDEFHISNMTQK